jgi:hypothetical protein
MRRRCFKQTASLEERLAEQAERLGIERERAIRKAQQSEIGSHISEWLNSPGLQPPK